MIHPYSHKPRPRFSYAGNENTNVRTYGLEVEVDNPWNGGLPSVDRYVTSDRLDDITDLLYCKSDSSLDDGFEIVTHPCSLKYHMNNFRWKFVGQTCVKAGWRSHNSAGHTCGLHIHVGRAQLTEDAIRKLVVLVTRYWNEIVNFSRRERSELNRWAPRPYFAAHYDPSYDGSLVRDLANTHIATYINDHDRRYTAVNVTNTGTVEFRVFRGTLKRDTIIAALQFVDNMCEYAMTHDYDDIQASTFADVALLKHYNELDKYLVKRGLIASEAVDANPINSRRQPDFEGADGLTEAA